MAVVQNVTALAGVVVAGGALVVTARASRASQRAAAELAHDARLWDKRAAAYVELLIWAIRLRETLIRTTPVIGPMPDPPAWPTDDELFVLEASVRAFGSREVDDLVDALSVARRQFQQQNEVVVHLNSNENVFGKTSPEAWQSLEEARKQSIVAIDVLAARIHEELAMRPLARPS